MKRSSPLKRGGSLLRRTPMPQPTQPIRHRSVRMERVYRTQRRPLVARLLAERPICERCILYSLRWAPSVDVHELLSRARGGSITDEANCVALCRRCHDEITTNPALAESEGWSLSQYGGTR